MAALLLCMLAASALGVLIPLEPDEAKVVACALIASKANDSDDVQAVVNVTVHDKDSTRQKINFEIQYNCYQIITEEYAVRATGDNVTVFEYSDEARALVKFNAERFTDPEANIDVTDEELEFFQRMLLLVSNKTSEIQGPGDLPFGLPPRPGGPPSEEEPSTELPVLNEDIPVGDNPEREDL